MNEIMGGGATTTKVTRLDDFTEVDMAEGRLLNEIHERISLGITLALGSLIAAARAEGIERASVGTVMFTDDWGIGCWGELEPTEGFSAEGKYETGITYDLIPRVKA